MRETTPNEQPATTQDAPSVTLDAPLTRSQIQEIKSMSREERNKRAEEDLAAIKNANSVPACRDRYSPPMQCLKAREDFQASHRKRREQEDADRLRVLLPSLDLDLAALPKAPIERAEALAGLRRKYGYGSSDLANELGPVPKEPSPRRQIVETLGNRIRAEFARVKQMPEVRHAFAENRLIGVDLQLTLEERIEWGGDAKTFHLIARARQAVGNKTLFMDRKVDLAESERERTQSANARQWGEHTANEMGLALLRAFVSTGGRFLSPYESERDTLGMLQFVRAGVRVVHIEKTQCQKSEDGYWCMLRLWQVPVIRGSGVGVTGTNHPVVGMLSKLEAEADRYQGVPIVHRFAPGNQGWTAPDLVESIYRKDQQAFDAIQASVDSMNRSICVQRRLSGDRCVAFDARCKGA